MKTILTILLFSFFFTAHSQIDSIVKKYNKDGIDSFAKTLDYSKVVDGTKQGTFDIDTIKLTDGEFKWFTISLTAISGNIRGQGLYAIAINNLGGIYSIAINTPISKWLGTTSISFNPLLINNNTMCVIRVTTGGLTAKFHYKIE